MRTLRTSVTGSDAKNTFLIGQASCDRGNFEILLRRGSDSAVSVKIQRSTSG